MRKIEGLLLECTCCGKLKPRGQFRNKNRGRGRSHENARDHLTYSSEKASWCKECEKPGAAARHAARRALEKASSGRYSQEDVREMMFLQHGRCRGCGKSLVVKGYHVDHVVPLSRGGRNDRSNLQLLCPSCNLMKSDRLPVTTPKLGA